MSNTTEKSTPDQFSIDSNAALRKVVITKCPEFGALVKEGRNNHNLTQAELAQKTNLTPAEISRIESGLVKKPSAKTVKALSPYVGVSYTKLLFYAGHSGISHMPVFFDYNMQEIPYIEIVSNVYHADAEILTLLKGFDCYASYEDRKLLKLLLTVMQKVHASGSDEKGPGKRIRKLFQATRTFLICQLSELLSL